MNAREYLKTDEKYELVLLMGAAYNIKNYAEETKRVAKTDIEREWAKNLKMASTLLTKTIKSRLDTLNDMQRADLHKRQQTCLLKVVPFDEARVQAYMRGRDMFCVPTENLMQVAELAMIGCHNCPQGEYVNKCEYRKSLHACGVPISENEREGKGRCEFRSEEGIHIILPQGNDKQAELLQQELDGIFTMKSRPSGGKVGEFF